MTPLSRRMILADPINCLSGKRAFLTEGEARHALGTTRGDDRDRREGRRPDEAEGGIYRCDVGGTQHWHLTSSPRARRRSALGNRGRRGGPR